MLSARAFSDLLVFGLLALSAAVFVETRGMTVGAELFPRIIAGTLAILAAAELARSVIAGRGAPETSPQGQAAEPRLTRRSAATMAAFFAMVIAFLVLFPLIGFEAAAVLFIAGGMLLLAGRRMLRLWYVAVLVPLGLVLIFRFGLGVRLPSLPFLP